MRSRYFSGYATAKKEGEGQRKEKERKGRKN